MAKEKVPTRVYRCWCLPATENAELVREQLYAATVYYNKCIELQLLKTQEYRAARYKHYPELVKAEEKCEALKLKMVDATEEEKKKLKEEIKKISDEAKELRKQASSDLEVANETKELRIVNAWRASKDFAPFDLETYRELRENKDPRLDVPPRIVNQVRPRIVEEMKEEDRWSAWWKDNADLDEEDNRRIRHARNLASEGRATNHQGKPVVAIPAGTYNLCEEDANKAWKDYRKNVRNPNIDIATRMKMIERGHPRFKSFDGSGRLGVQLRPGMYVIGDEGNVQGEHLQLWAEAKKPWTSHSHTAHEAPTPGSKRQKARDEEHGWGFTRIRLGSNGRKPIWAIFPTRIWKWLNNDLTITQACLVVKKEGPKATYELQLTTQSPSHGELPKGEGIVAINIGWRALGDGRYRLAYAMDSNREVRELILPKSEMVQRGKSKRMYWSIVKRFQFVEQRNSNISLCFNEARDALVTWLDDHKSWKELKEVTKNLRDWRSPKKLVKACGVFCERFVPKELLTEHWLTWRLSRDKENLFPERDVVVDWCQQSGITDRDQQLAIYLHFWRRKNLHLYYDLTTRIRNKAIEHRRQIVQSWSKDIAQTYNKVLLQDYKVKEIPGACTKEELVGWSEEDRREHDALVESLRSTLPAQVGRKQKGKTKNTDPKDIARRIANLTRKNRVMLAPGEVRLILNRTCGYKGIDIGVKDDTDGDSQKCTHCDHVDKTVDRAHKIEITCKNCGWVEDQDERACINMLNRHKKGLQKCKRKQPSKAKNGRRKTNGSTRNSSKAYNRITTTPKTTGLPSLRSCTPSNTQETGGARA